MSKEIIFVFFLLIGCTQSEPQIVNDIKVNDINEVSMCFNGFEGKSWVSWVFNSTDITPKAQRIYDYYWEGNELPASFQILEEHPSYLNDSFLVSKGVKIEFFYSNNILFKKYYFPSFKTGNVFVIGKMEGSFIFNPYETKDFFWIGNTKEDRYRFNPNANISMFLNVSRPLTKEELDSIWGLNIINELFTIDTHREIQENDIVEFIKDYAPFKKGDTRKVVRKRIGQDGILVVLQKIYPCRFNCIYSMRNVEDTGFRESVMIKNE